MAESASRDDTRLVEGLVRHELQALRQVWDRYLRTTHWVCALYEPDGTLVATHLEGAFLDLWASSPAVLRGRSLPEQLVVAARRRCVRRRPRVKDWQPTIERLDCLSDPQLAGVALLFSGEFAVNEVSKIVGCERGELGRSLHTVLGGDLDRSRASRQMSRCDRTRLH